MLPFDQDICIWFVTPARLLSQRYYYVYTNTRRRKKVLYFAYTIWYKIYSERTRGKCIIVFGYIIHIFGLDERHFSKDKGFMGSLGVDNQVSLKNNFKRFTAWVNTL